MRYRYRPACAILIFAVALLQFGSVLSLAGDSIKGLRIYYIRHAEGGHNVKQDWIDAGIPEEEWPDYVGDPDQFTPLGLTQVETATKKLRNTHFDFIGVSPLWRCRHTVLPYLKETGSKGEIWPELRESYASSLIVSPDLPLPPDVPILGAGSLITLPPEETPYFFLREDGMYNFKLPDYPDDHSDKENETAAMKVVLQRVLDMIQERFGGSDTSILLVGHGSSGKGIVRMFTNDALPGFPGLSNTGIWMVEEQPSGEFELKIFNDLPVVNGELITDPDLFPTLEQGNTWYHNYFPFEFNAPLISTIGGSLTTSETTPSSSINPGTLVSKFVRDSSAESYIRFKLPENLTNLGSAIFKVSVYAPSDGSSGNNSIQLVLRKDDHLSTQLSLKQEISEYDRWVEYTFDMSTDSIKEDYYNAIYLYFDSQDEDREGEVYYLDAFQGPKNPYNVTFRIKDQWSDSLLQHISVFAGQREKLTDSKGEVTIALPEGKQSIRISHPDYTELVSTLEVSKDTLVLISLTPSTKSVVFHIVSENSQNPLSNISVVMGEYEATTGIDGNAYFHLLKGPYGYSLNHPEYFTTSSSLVVSSDTTITIILKANKAKIKFRIYSEDKPLYNAVIELSGASLKTNQTGIAVFEDLLRYEDYQWSASKEGFEVLAGTMSLMNDTSVNLSMSPLTAIADHGLHGLSLYPNPAYLEFFIDSETAISRVEICDLRGRLMGHLETNERKLKLHIAGYPNGIYFVKIYRDGLRTVCQKLIKFY